jgi:hypothetical protein
MGTIAARTARSPRVQARKEKSGEYHVTFDNGLRGREARSRSGVSDEKMEGGDECVDGFQTVRKLKLVGQEDDGNGR